MTRVVRLGVVALAALLVAARADAQCNANGAPASCSLNLSWQVVVQRTVRVTITPTVATLTNPNATDFNNGFSAALGHTAVVKANNAWQILISSGQALWTAGGGGRADKPRADLAWGLAVGGPFTTITGTPAQVTTGTATASTSVPIYYQVLWVWNLDIPGTYTLPVTLTISAP